MKVDRAWKEASAKLSALGIEDALLEAELLLRQALEMERTGFYSGLDGELTSLELTKLEELLAQRLARRPNAYIRHVKEFYGLEFYVDERVLIPRPETELLVEKALEVARQYTRNPRVFYSPLSVNGEGPAVRSIDSESSFSIADIGTGSGAIAVALAVNLPDAEIYATDISEAALEVAEINCQKHRVADRTHLLRGDLLTPLNQSVDIIVANLPYIPDTELDRLAPEVSLYEPRSALSGGQDGLDYIRRLLEQAPGKLKPGGALLLEVGMGQAEVVAEMARRHFSDVTVAADLAGIGRVVAGSEKRS